MRNLSKRVLGLALVAVFVVAGTVAVQAVRAADCATTYDNFGKGFMEKYCLGCHHSSKSGLSRKGAPAKYDFDTPEMIKAEKGEIIEVVVDKKSMPPFLKRPSDDDRAKVKQWIECEYP